MHTEKIISLRHSPRIESIKDHILFQSKLPEVDKIVRKKIKILILLTATKFLKFIGMYIFSGIKISIRSIGRRKQKRSFGIAEKTGQPSRSWIGRFWCKQHVAAIS